MKRGLILIPLCVILFVGWRSVQIVFDFERSPSPFVFSRNEMLAVVVPHHDLVKKERRDLLKRVSFRLQPDTIILLSPNHFYNETPSIVTTDYTWKLQGGNDFLLSDSPLIHRILKRQGVKNDTAMVRGDHGITNLIGDIHEFFPKSRIVPILFSDVIASIEVKRLEEDIARMCDGHCGVIASVDMSHYQSAKTADFHDIKTIRALELLDDNAISGAEVDSRASLTFLMEWARHFSLRNFTLAFHTNSGKMSENFDIETTTHIAGYYTSGSVKTVSSNVTFTIAGSVLGCQNDRKNFSELSDFGTRALWGTDLSWVFWDDDSKSSGLKEYLVKKWNWPEASVEADTSMEANGIVAHRTNIGNQRVVFLSANAENAFIGSRIQNEKEQGYFVIFLPRWEGKYSVQHTEEQQRKSLSWIHAGAGLIAGFHKKGIQDMEMIDGVPVFYSLGGFLNECGETHGLMINGSVEEGKVSFSLDPIRSKNLGITLLSESERKQLFRIYTIQK